MQHRPPLGAGITGAWHPVQIKIHCAVEVYIVVIGDLIGIALFHTAPEIGVKIGRTAGWKVIHRHDQTAANQRISVGGPFKHANIQRDGLIVPLIIMGGGGSGYHPGIAIDIIAITCPAHGHASPTGDAGNVIPIALFGAVFGAVGINRVGGFNPDHRACWAAG